MKIFTILAISAMGLALAACGSSKGAKSAQTAVDTPAEEVSVGVSLDGDKPIIMRRGLNGLDSEPVIGSAPMALPKVLLYRTSGNFNDNVPVQLGADGQLISFPSPTDIPADAAPLQLANGWLLSRVGVSPSSVFTRWTFAEYRAMATPPTPDEILAAVIPGAKVTMTMQAPMTVSEALADTAAVNEYILANSIYLLPQKQP